MRGRRRLASPVRSLVGFAVLAAAAGFALLGAGCGYSQNGSASVGGYQWKSLYRGDVNTVAVQVFDNRTFYRGLEFGLTKAVVNQIEAQSPYKVVPKERADTILEGRIDSVGVTTLSLDEHGAVIPQEQRLVMNIAFTWKDLRTGKTLVERRDFQQTASYYPTLGEDRFVAQQQSVETLATAIVHEMQADW